jgi:hypothetical protein
VERTGNITGRRHGGGLLLLLLLLLLKLELELGCG